MDYVEADGITKCARRGVNFAYYNIKAIAVCQPEYCDISVYHAHYIEDYTQALLYANTIKGGLFL